MSSNRIMGMETIKMAD